MIGRILSHAGKICANAIIGALVLVVAAPVAAQDRRWVMVQELPAGRAGSDETGMMAVFQYQSNGLLPGEDVIATISRYGKPADDEPETPYGHYLVALSSIEDVGSRFKRNRMWGFADWGFCGLVDGECVKYLPMSGYVGPMVPESVFFEGQPPRATATCFRNMDEAYQKQFQGGKPCGPSTMRVMVPSTAVTYDRFMSKLARFDAFDRGNVRLALRLNDGEEEFFYLTMHLTYLPEMLEAAVTR